MTYSGPARTWPNMGGEKQKLKPTAFPLSSWPLTSSEPSVLSVYFSPVHSSKMTISTLLPRPHLELMALLLLHRKHTSRTMRAELLAPSPHLPATVPRSRFPPVTMAALPIVLRPQHLCTRSHSLFLDKEMVPAILPSLFYIMFSLYDIIPISICVHFLSSFILKQQQKQSDLKMGRGSE